MSKKFSYNLQGYNIPIHFIELIIELIIESNFELTYKSNLEPTFEPVLYTGTQLIVKF